MMWFFSILLWSMHDHYLNDTTDIVSCSTYGHVFCDDWHCSAKSSPWFFVAVFVMQPMGYCWTFLGFAAFLSFTTRQVKYYFILILSLYNIYIESLCCIAHKMVNDKYTIIYILYIVSIPDNTSLLIYTSLYFKWNWCSHFTFITCSYLFPNNITNIYTVY